MAKGAISPHVEVVGLASGPQTIRSEADVVRAGPAFAECVASDPGADAYIRACFSDPGIEIARTITARPVIGRHRRRLRAMGVLSRLADERALDNMSFGQSGECSSLDGAVIKAREMRDRGAEAIVLGRAGMSPPCADLARAVGAPVIDPVTAAASMALGRVLIAGADGGVRGVCAPVCVFRRCGPDSVCIRLKPRR